MVAIDQLAPGSSAAGVAAPPGAAVAVSNVRKSYGDRQVLRGLDLQIATGEVFGLLGPNGAGKTTFVECLVGLRRPDAGAVSVLGMNPAGQRPEFTSRVSLQPQDASLFENIRAREALDLFASFHTRPLATQDVLEQIGLTDSDRQLVRKLSGGQRRRLLLGVAMIGNPELIVLDEPSAGLDPQARHGLWAVIERLRDNGSTVLLTTHHMDEAAALCDRVAFLVDGSFAAVGTPTELVGQLSGGQRVSFSIPTADPNRVHAELSALPMVRAVEISGSRPAHVTVHTDNSDAVLGHLGRTDWQPSGISLHTGDLENVFLALAGEPSEESDTPGKETRR